MPDIKFDFSQVTYPGALEILAPVVPGSIIALGTLIFDPQLASRLIANPHLGYKTRIFAAILISYIAGLLLNLLVNYVSYVAGYLVGKAFGKKLFPNFPTPARMVYWRRVVREFIGDKLAPSTNDVYFKELHDAELAKVELIQDPQQKAAQLQLVQNAFIPKSIAEGEWFFWYEVLTKYFVLEQRWAPPGQYFVVMVHTASWAVILVMALTHNHHWFAWVLAMIGIFFGLLGQWFTGGAIGDPYAVNQTAMLLQRIKTQSDSASTPST